MDVLLAVLVYLGIAAIGTVLVWLYYELKDRRHRRRCVAQFDAHIASFRSRSEWGEMDIVPWVEESPSDG